MATQAELEQVRRALNRLSSAADADLQAIWDGLRNSDRVVVGRALSQGWEWVLTRYGEQAATLAADFFEVEALNLGLTPRVRLPAPIGEREATSRLGWAMSTADPRGNLSVVLDELVKRPYRDTMQQSAHASGGAYARVPTGSHTCAFCMMLASRGAVYRSEDTAAGSKYHGKCDCQPVLVRGPQDYPESYNPGSLFDAYDAARAEAGTGNTKAILSALRQQQATN